MVEKDRLLARWPVYASHVEVCRERVWPEASPCRRLRAVPSEAALAMAEIEQHALRPARKRSLFWGFPYVCPEPVLVKRSVLVQEVGKGPFSTSPPL